MLGLRNNLKISSLYSLSYKMDINEQHMLIIQGPKCTIKLYTTHNITTLLPHKFDLSKNEYMTSYHKHNLNI